MSSREIKCSQCGWARATETFVVDLDKNANEEKRYWMGFCPNCRWEWTKYEPKPVVRKLLKKKATMPDCDSCLWNDPESTPECRKGQYQNRCTIFEPVKVQPPAKRLLVKRRDS